jgi:hypothetical protein
MHRDEPPLKELEQKRSGFNREQAKLILDDVANRYGFTNLNQVPARLNSLPAAAKGVGEGQLPATISEHNPADEVGIQESPLRCCPLLDFQWHQCPDMTLFANEPPSFGPWNGSGTNNVVRTIAMNVSSGECFEFHFLIRIVECAITLHCQIRAQTAIEARNQVERIPNLIEWTEVSAKELAELVEVESAN